MAKALVAFTHFDLEVAAGEELPDDHELVALAPHLFEQPPEPDPDSEGPPVRVRGPLATPAIVGEQGPELLTPKSTRKPRTNKDA